MKKSIAVIVGVIILFFIISEYNSSIEEKYKSTETHDYKSNNNDYDENKIGVAENIKLDKKYDNAWILKGMIRNNTNNRIKGGVNIKFKNSNNDIVHTAKAFVNNGDYLEKNQAGNFQYATAPSDFDGVVDYEIDFFEN